MKKYDFNTIIDRQGTDSLKTSPAVVKNFLGLNCYDDTIYLWVADMDFPCAPKIIKALKDRAGDKIFGYTYESREYADSIIDWYKRRHDINIEKSSLVYSKGTVSGIRNILRALTNEGDGVIIQEPVYYPFAAQINETGRKVVNNKLLCDMDNKYSIDIIDFEKKAKQHKNKVFILCNPHNPVGQIWKENDIVNMMEICQAYDVIVIADEIHCDLIRKNADFVSAYNIYKGDKLILATAANKTFNLAGLEITNFVIDNPDIRKRLTDYTGSEFINPFSARATITAYNDCEDWVEELNVVLDENFDFMDEYIKHNLPGVRFNKPEGTYLALLDFRDYGLSEDELVRKIAEEARVIVEPGSLFGPSIEGFVRLNAACPKAVLKEALERISKIWR